VYVWLGLCAVVLPPSPKFQVQLVIALLPGADWSVNWTVNGLDPLVGFPANSAVGGTLGAAGWSSRAQPKSIAHRHILASKM
jgi:hypothetical protein